MAGGAVRPLGDADPRRIGPYALEGLLGHGGMGRVYLGRTPDGRPVAVKVISADLALEPEYRARFRREADLARRVARFCTAEVLDANVDGPTPYLVTEYLDGPTLWSAVKSDGPMGPADVERIAVAVAAALTAIHSAELVHRDLKPGNVLLSSLGPRVIDFGIARALDATTVLTDRTGAVGTPSFMAPEQAVSSSVTAAADIFAWGGLVLFAATGRLPFGNGEKLTVLYRVVHDQPDFTDLDGPLRTIVEEAMRKDPSDRPSAQELLARMVGDQHRAQGSGNGSAPLLGMVVSGVPSRPEGADGSGKSGGTGLVSRQEIVVAARISEPRPGSPLPFAEASRAPRAPRAGSSPEDDPAVVHRPAVRSQTRPMEKMPEAAGVEMMTAQVSSIEDAVSPTRRGPIRARLTAGTAGLIVLAAVGIGLGLMSADHRLVGRPASPDIHASPTSSVHTQAPEQAWRDVLVSLDNARSSAFARADEAGLLDVDALDSTAHTRDLTLMRQMVAKGGRASGLRREIIDLAVWESGSEKTVLRITYRLPPYTFVDAAGTVLAQQPGYDRQESDVTLVKTDRGWRVALSVDPAG
ncbi:hypothetical protein FDG2_4810 [Candidatus Protofrankia californiensis]|uniref:Protein kinase domain-containing protein n=1 Tax=Candidatus Protofrankia californiensis TaxID=1839754 RepID=A0A1C3P8Q7_9ACTN|nr:hypothetical protein FDG2_4810 [Candidatus Protofrankia californiensis]